MASPFVAEIRIFPFNFAPVGWALCNGQTMPINQNTALFSLLGTTFGGDGKTTFALPNLQGSAPLMPGQAPGLSPYSLGQTGGETNVTLTQNQMPSHRHTVKANSGPGTQSSPANADWASASVARQSTKLYAVGESNTTMSAQALSSTGGSQPHNNMPPYLVLNFCIALQGVFPPRG
jgi:microcystin-dependent protein